MRHRVSGVALLFMLTFLSPATVPARAQAGTSFTLGGWLIVEFIQPQPACDGVGYEHETFRRADCGFGRVTISPATAGKQVRIEFVNPDGAVVSTVTETTSSGGVAEFSIIPRQAWGPGRMTVRASMVAPDTGSSSAPLVINPLVATVLPEQPSYTVGETITITGNVSEYDLVTCCVESRTPVPALVTATLHAPDGSQLGPAAATAATSDGDYAVTFPGTATAALQAGPETNFALSVAARLEVRYDDPTPVPSNPPMTSGKWSGTGSGAISVTSPPDGLLVETSFVSPTGWVKPGGGYPFRVIIRNHTDETATATTVTLTEPIGGDLVAAVPSPTIVAADTFAWQLSDVIPGQVVSIVVQGEADTFAEDPEIVWKDLSASTSVTYVHAGLGRQAGPATSHGPKVIPPTGGFETARYGDKPFPMVPVDYTDRKHEEGHSGSVLDRVVNAPDYAPSTLNLYQEMSYGQLFPHGTVPSAGVATAGFAYGPGFDFVDLDEARGCRGATYGQDGLEFTWGTPIYPERIDDGWYQLPGDTEYYGGDFPVFTAVPLAIDSACGPTGKSVYDAAQIADPEVDYDQYDFDKDGVVDFFMMVFVGRGGNGDSQINGTPPYDNIWPHSSSLEQEFTEETTGLKGYVSDDQLKSLAGVPQCWTSEQRIVFTDCQAAGGTGRDDLPTPVRVGPYNVNPETAIERNSVISHEYGHHLGLPDFYSLDYAAYDTWNLMAADHAQNMTVFGKQELGWVVPRPLDPGTSTTVSAWREIKTDTGEIHWETPDGTPYVLTGANGDERVRNGEAYVAKLPGRLLVDPAKIASQASAVHVWHSGSGNDFGCSPESGHNLDIRLPELSAVGAGTPVTLNFKSSWDIEWDFDYGFVLLKSDATEYTSQASANGFTTSSAFNPNGIGCLDTHDNGITGASESYRAGTQTADRNPASPRYPGSPFLVDRYDLSEFAGQEGVVLRFSYSTDVGLARPGWFIDDLTITAGSTVLYLTDFEEPEPGRIFPGGCAGGIQVAERCTDGWVRVKSDDTAPQDHAYYLELRDRASFDLDGRGQSDRGLVDWFSGMLVEYTDEVRGYGNVGYPQPPTQHYLDSQPDPGFDCFGDDPTGIGLIDDLCDDAAFTDTPGDNEFGDTGWIDNFDDSRAPDDLWHFDYGCLTVTVVSMTGEGDGPATLPADLSATVRMDAGSGCRPFSYFGPFADGPPTAVAQARPTTTEVGRPVAFDGSSSFDDVTPPDQLIHRWDFDDDGAVDAVGQAVSHVFAQPAIYTARLEVVDRAGLSDTATITVTVTPPVGPPPTPPTTQPQPEPGPRPPALSRTFAFAEGTTLAGFEEYLLLSNPGETIVTGTVAYLVDAGEQPAPQQFALGPGSRLTLHVPDAPGVGRGRTGVGALIEASAPVAAERALYFDASVAGLPANGAHAVLGAGQAQTTWSFAEGTTQPGFQEYMTLLNPSTQDTLARLTFGVEGGAARDVAMLVPAGRRATLDVSAVLPGVTGHATGVVATEPIYVERVIYYDATVAGLHANGGHVSFGTSPAKELHFAEGNVLPDFRQFITLSNPDPTAAIDVELSYLPSAGSLLRRAVTVPAGSRRTVQVFDASDPGGIGTEVSDPVSRGVSLQVRTQAARGVIVERPTYFDRTFPGHGGPVSGGHTTPGALAPATAWHFAEGTTLPGFDTFITIENPGGAEQAKVTYFTDVPGEAPIVREIALAASSRTTVQVFGPPAQGGLGLERTGVSIRVEAATPIVVERPLYVYGRVGGLDLVSAGTDVVGFVANS